MIYLDDKYKKIVLSILQKYPYTFYIYGSRVKGTQHRTSDIDICFTDPIPLSVQAHIEEDFEESDLPFQVDLSDFNLMSRSFQEKIKNEMYLLQQKTVSK